MTHHGTANGGIQSPTTTPRETPGHRCGRCATPYGVSAIPCPNSPEQAWEAATIAYGNPEAQETK